MSHRPCSAERGPHGSCGHEADAGSEAAHDPLPGAVRALYYGPIVWGREARLSLPGCVTCQPRCAERCLHWHERGLRRSMAVTMCLTVRAAPSAAHTGAVGTRLTLAAKLRAVLCLCAPYSMGAGARLSLSDLPAALRGALLTRE